MLGFINGNFSFKNKDIILPLYISLVRPHLEYTVPFRWPHPAKDIAKLEAVQQRATKMITSLRNKSYEERLASLNLFSLEKRRLRGKLIECFKILKGFTNVDASKLFSINNKSRTRSNGVKFRCKQVQLDSIEFLFTNDVAREWNKLPPSVVQCDYVCFDCVNSYLACFRKLLPRLRQDRLAWTLGSVWSDILFNYMKFCLIL